jgi:hypothetical protein
MARGNRNAEARAFWSLAARLLSLLNTEIAAAKGWSAHLRP